MVALENNVLEVGDNKLFQGGSKRMVRLDKGKVPRIFTLPGLNLNFTYTENGGRLIIEKNVSKEDFFAKRKAIDFHAPEWANAFFYYDDVSEIDEQEHSFNIFVEYFKIPEGNISYALRLLKIFDGRTKEYEKLYSALLNEDL